MRYVLKSITAVPEQFACDVEIAVYTDNNKTLINTVQRYFTTDKAVARQCAEDMYLFDLRRNNPHSYDYELPADVVTIKTVAGWTQANKGWIPPVDADLTGFTTVEFLGVTYYLPPEEWIEPTEEVVE